jgi:phage terminase large subunit-like protein
MRPGVFFREWSNNLYLCVVHPKINNLTNMVKNKTIIVKDTPVTITNINDSDYISLTDMMKAKDGDFFFSNWLRNRNTIEFLGIWEKLNNPEFNCVEFDIIKSQAGLNSY